MEAAGWAILANPDARDLLAEVLSVEDGVDVVHHSLAAAAAFTTEYLEAHDAAAALAAAELVAAARGASSPDLPPEAVAWAARHGSLAALGRGARAACDAVMRASELADRVEETGAAAAAAWQAAVTDLARRLG